nr:DMT family transporter [Propionivibrio sp.]
GASVFDFIGLQYISAGLERLIIFTYPTLTLLIGVLFMGKAIRAREIGALLLSYAGIGLAFMHDLQFGSDTRLVLIGALFVFASSISYALYLSGSAPMIQRLGAARFTALAVLASTISTLLHFLLTQPVAALNQPVPVYAYAAAMSLFSTILPVFMLAAAIRHIGSTTAALIGTLGPVLTVVFSWWLLDEPISLAQMAGTTLVLGGVLLVSARSISRE